jgi:hypothetical protein
VRGAHGRECLQRVPGQPWLLRREAFNSLSSQGAKMHPSCWALPWPLQVQLDSY